VAGPQNESSLTPQRLRIHVDGLSLFRQLTGAWVHGSVSRVSVKVRLLVKRVENDWGLVS
jgi:hypothetical protein